MSQSLSEVPEYAHLIDKCKYHDSFKMAIVYVREYLTVEPMTSKEMAVNLPQPSHCTETTSVQRT